MLRSRLTAVMIMLEIAIVLLSVGLSVKVSAGVIRTLLVEIFVKIRDVVHLGTRNDRLDFKVTPSF